MHALIGPGDPPEKKQKKHDISFKDAYSNATGKGEKMYQDITELRLEVYQKDFNVQGEATIRMDTPENFIKYGERALVHGTIKLERLSSDTAQVIWNPELNCRCGMYDFDIHMWKGANDLRNNITAMAGVLHTYNPSAIFKGGIIYGPRPFPIQYINVIKIKP